MWEISGNLQLLNFFRSVIFGVIISLFYDIIKGFRLSKFHSFFAVLFLDVFFFVLLTPVFFCYLIATTNGQIRGYIIVGIILGFLIFRYTVSKFVFKIYFKVLKGILKFAAFANFKINLFFDLIYLGFLKSAKFVLKIIKKTLKSLKKVLKK